LGSDSNGKSFLIQQAASSPDSAVYSANFSPNQSPITSRNVSGLSSPFSRQTSPTLSRNSSDAFQYGRNLSVVSDPLRISARNLPLQGRQLNPQVLKIVIQIII